MVIIISLQDYRKQRLMPIRLSTKSDSSEIINQYNYQLKLGRQLIDAKMMDGEINSLRTVQPQCYGSSTQSFQETILSTSPRVN